VTREEFLGLGAEYAAGGLDGDELESFLAYLKKASPAEAQEVAEFLSAASLLPLALESKVPPTHMKKELLRRIGARDSIHQRMLTLEGGTTFTGTPAWRRWQPLGIAVSGLAMVLAFTLYVTNLLETIDGQTGTIDRQNTRLVELQAELQRKEELLNILSARRVEIVIMSGLGDHTGAFGKILWDPERRVAILQVSNLPPVPPDKDYQLWVIKGAQPFSAGVFSVGSTESYHFRVDHLAVTEPGQIAAFALTLEPKGGVPAPTGTMYMAGSPKL